MHTIRDKKRLTARVRRVRGQIEAVERALVEEWGCEAVVRTIMAARGAVNSLAAEVLCGHVNVHLGATAVKHKARAAAATELTKVIRQLVA
jgi:DNA-binding FrmR family transcriptional regulator